MTDGLSSISHIRCCWLNQFSSGVTPAPFGKTGWWRDRRRQGEEGKRRRKREREDDRGRRVKRRGRKGRGRRKERGKTTEGEE